jgi:uncharacterized damage-inducible protein DinB
MSAQPEWWMRGPVDGIAAPLQPAAHMVLQLRDEISALVTDLPLEAWNARPASVASIAFHIRHIPGVLDRMATYARGAALDDAQRAALKRETEPLTGDVRQELLDQLRTQVDRYLDELRHTDPATLGDFRGIGRAQLPSTVIGCLMHGAEHSMRHLGQLLVTTHVVRSSS